MPTIIFSSMLWVNLMLRAFRPIRPAWKKRPWISVKLALPNIKQMFSKSHYKCEHRVKTSKSRLCSFFYLLLFFFSSSHVSFVRYRCLCNTQEQKHVKINIHAWKRNRRLFFLCIHKCFIQKKSSISNWVT